MREEMTKFRWFWAWQDDREEAWLSRMARLGWHLESVAPFCFYRFVAGEKADYTYRLDYRVNRKDKEYYLRLFQDAGWEHVAEMSGWHYFRKKVVEGEYGEIFSDIESKVMKYRRLLTFIGFILLMNVYLLTNRILIISPYEWWGAVQVIHAAAIILLLYAVIRISLRIRHLRKSGMNV